MGSDSADSHDPVTDETNVRQENWKIRFYFLIQRAHSEPTRGVKTMTGGIYCEKLP